MYSHIYVYNCHLLVIIIITYRRFYQPYKAQNFINIDPKILLTYQLSLTPHCLQSDRCQFSLVSLSEGVECLLQLERVS